MRAISTCSMNFGAHSDEQDLAAFDSLNLNLFFLAIFEVDRADALQLEFGGHSSVKDAEARRLGVERSGRKVDAKRSARQACQRKHIRVIM
jgi:hypothetical protein